MTTFTTKQVRLTAVAVMAVVLLCIASLDAAVVPRTVQCRDRNDTCSSGSECCGDMVCLAGECDLTDVPEGCDYSLHAGLFAGINYAAPSGKFWGLKCLAPGTCENLNTTADDGEEMRVSSVNWSEHTGIQLFDAVGCGGTSLMVYSSGEYNAIIDGDNSTRVEGFLAGGIPNLASVCKYEVCGTMDVSVNGIKFEKCVCEETWDKSVMSYRILKRDTDTSASSSESE